MTLFSVHVLTSCVQAHYQMTLKDDCFDYTLRVCVKSKYFGLEKAVPYTAFCGR